ncbi:hypothetical protein EST38_g7184 [Candolleomyces aberdarensis]|uniref:Uncharacterized protein n=1 Tax=Candolleomyces aberdarensis TaxID=2316362 RepID=A0A4Q2DFS0_9AGAR|nr:hypothetical protein EST38_g7184 [Candolleomyces aberdarensis]
MSYISPFTNPQQYISKVNKFSSEGITIDDGVARRVGEAADFASKYSSYFLLVSELKDLLEQFNGRWTKALLDSRDAALSISAWLQRFDQVFLSTINEVASQQDTKDFVAELNPLLNEEYPTKKQNLGGVPGPKNSFEEIEGLVTQESKHIIAALQASNWQQGIADLKEDLPQLEEPYSEAGICPLRLR